MDVDELWHAEATRMPIEGWTLSHLQTDLEDAWGFYEQMLRDVTDSQYAAYVQGHHGLMPRPAYELSREITAWRLHD